MYGVSFVFSVSPRLKAWSIFLQHGIHEIHWVLYCLDPTLVYLLQNNIRSVVSLNQTCAFWNSNPCILKSGDSAKNCKRKKNTLCAKRCLWTNTEMCLTFSTSMAKIERNKTWNSLGIMLPWSYISISVNTFWYIHTNIALLFPLLLWHLNYIHKKNVALSQS